jgi:hypothetical protein
MGWIWVSGSKVGKLKKNITSKLVLGGSTGVGLESKATIHSIFLPNP